MARNAAIITSAENLGKFSQRKSKLEGPLSKLDALDSGVRKYPVAAVRPL
jgi:hypothetical protein